MKKQSITIVSALLFLVFALSACGAQPTNSGPTADGSTTANTTSAKLHSGGACWSRDGDVASHADLADNADPPQWAAGGSPFFGAKILACQDVIFLSWSTGYDFYQVRWSRPGMSEQQFSTGLQGSQDFTNAHFSTIYTFRLQGCNNGFWGSSCTGWSPTITVATYFPGDCLVGYVWRGANSSDTVCVTPQTRDQTAYDNSQRYNRIDPNGAYGPDTCIQGYVWREAFSGDHVCVTTDTRSQAAYDNTQASVRSYH